MEKISSEMQIETVPISDLNPAVYNPRTISEGSLAGLEHSLRKFGVVEPIVWNRRTGNVVGGHQRLKVLQKAGTKQVTVAVVDLDELNEKELNLTLNNPHVAGEFDLQKLDQAIKDIEGTTQGQQDAVDLKIAELKEELAGLDFDEQDDAPVDAEPQIDMAEELREKWNVETGQLWACGDHRLLCGDSTKAEDVARVMGKDNIGAVVTDPPYGMSAVSSSGVLSVRYTADIVGDETPELARIAFKSLANINVPQIWWGANYYADATGSATCWLVWNKNNGQSDQADAELAWTNLDGVVRMFEIASEKQNRIHPTQKHPDLIRWCIEKCGDVNIIYDPFLGSGTTLIACEQLKRKCRAIEISPGYVAVALQRYMDATGTEPKLQGKGA